MNHPKPEAWVPYLYGGLKPSERRQLRAHLDSCPECRGEVARWQRTTRRLDAWKLPRSRPTLEWFAPGLKWAAVALVVLGIGFSLGRFTGTDAIASRVRAQLEPQVRQEMAQLVRAEVGRSTAAMLQASAQQTEKLLAAYTAEDARLDAVEASCVALKRQLNTVAINTENGFIQLASYHPPASGNSSQ